MAEPVEKLPVRGGGRPTNHAAIYRQIKVLLDGKPYRFAVSQSQYHDACEVFANCIYYLAKSHGRRASVRVAKDRKSITAQLFNRRVKSRGICVAKAQLFKPAFQEKP